MSSVWAPANELFMKMCGYVTNNMFPIVFNSSETYFTWGSANKRKRHCLQLLLLQDFYFLNVFLCSFLWFSKYDLGGNLRVPLNINSM